VSLPHLLLVDDSEAMLAFERAALSGHYAISTATNGRDALAKADQIRPAAVLLDLSMPEMDGDEVLAQMQRDEDLRNIPVIVISSEKQRAQECMRNGAKAYLPKPIKAQDLLPLVASVLEESRRERRSGSLAALFLSVAGIEIGIPLDAVRSVLHQSATRPLPLGPHYVSEVLDLHGEPVLVLDLARRLGRQHALPIEERKLVVVDCESMPLAICVDEVRDPEELSPDQLVRRAALAGSEHGPLRDALVAMARTGRGPLPVIDPRALVSRRLCAELMRSLRAESAS
jgi:CheY-like chemotaxis protein/chemotaxis signal transduction protein